MTIVDAIFSDDVEPNNFVSVGDDGTLVVARFGDMVVGRAIFSIVSGKMVLQDCWSFRMDGMWVWDSDNGNQRFYKDKFTPTNKYMRINFEEIGCIDGLSINELIKLVESYKNDDKFRVYVNDDGELSVTWTDEWEE